MWYPQEYGSALSQRVPAGTGHRQSRESDKHLSSMFNPLAPSYFQTAFHFGVSKEQHFGHPTSSQHFLAFLFHFTLDSHAVCKDSGKLTDLIRRIIKHSNNWHSIAASLSSSVPVTPSGPILSFLQKIFFSCIVVVILKNTRPWNSNIANKLRKRCK